MSQIFVKSFTHLKDHPNAGKALSMLQRVASLVKPIMRKHGWILPVLSEFFPESPNLVGLNVNGGQKILLRLRPAHSPDTFYDEENVVHNMLHELTHNVHAPHNDKFYQFLAELEDEYEALKRSGYAGEGFFSTGHRLGENLSHNLPPHVARQRASEAAEKRRRVGGMLGGAHRLGRSVIRRNLTPRELAAEAAERRVRDEKSCASGAAAEHEAEKAARESVEDVIDLTGDSDTEVIILDETLPSGEMAKVAAHTHISPHVDSESRKRPASSPAPRSQSRRRAPPKLSSARPTTPPPSYANTPVRCRSPLPSKDASGWDCPRCTLGNESSALQCVACMLIRPFDKPRVVDGWSCMTCGEVGMPHQFWSCRLCGNMKMESTVG